MSLVVQTLFGFVQRPMFIVQVVCETIRFVHKQMTGRHVDWTIRPRATWPRSFDTHAKDRHFRQRRITKGFTTDANGTRGAPPQVGL